MALAENQLRAMQRGGEIAHTVKRLRKGLYRVPSTSDAGVEWTVIEVGYRLQCTCPSGLHGRVCRHAAAVQQRRAIEAEKRSPTTGVG